MNLIRRKSEKYLFYEALERRLVNVSTIKNTLQEALRKEGGGYAGELRVDREIEESDFFKSYILMKGLIVGSSTSYAQIDTFIIHEKFLLIIEVKNLPGIIKLDNQLHQITRQRENGPVEGMRNPEDQLLRSERFVRKFLSFHNISMPVHGLIVFSNPSSVLEKPFSKKSAIHVSGLHQTLESLHLMYADHLYPKFEPRKIQLLFTQYEFELNPYKPSHILSKINTEILQGVLCPQCINKVLIYRNKFWRCSQCHYKNAEEHRQALKEYRSLFSHKVTTKEWMKFSGIRSASTASRMLQKSNLFIDGTFKNRRYVIPRDL